MSLTLNMVGGGGSFTATDAILRVQAPSGSIVTISKGSTTKSDFGHPNIDRPTIYDYYFIIHQSQFDSLNPWTVTATRNTDTDSTTIIINASDEYDIIFSYHVPINIYQEVEYLSSTAAKTQYINTNIGAFDSFDVDFQYMEMYSGQSLHSILGYRNDVAALRMMGITTWEGKFDVRPPTATGTINYTRTMDLNRHHVQSGEYFNKQIIFDGDIVFTYTGTQDFPNVTGFLFNEHQGNRVVGPSYSRIYSAKIWKNGNLEREFYPCYRVSDSVAGMYDKVNDVFYTNAGSGTFVVGSDV